MADDLRASIADAIGEVSEDETVEVEVTNPEVATEPVVEEAPTVETETAPEEVTKTESTEVAPTVELPPPPASWKGDAKQVWADLPEAARNEVIRREGNVNRLLAETAETRQFAAGISEVVQRHSARINEFGVPPAQVLDSLLEADRMLSTSEPIQRAQYMAKLIKDYGIDIGALDNALSGATPAIPDVSRQVQMQVDAALAPFRQQQEATKAEQQQAVVDAIEMMTDNPQYPLFDDIRDEMADLIEIKAQRGIYISLNDAYNIMTGQSNIAQVQQQKAAAKQITATAQKAKSAAVSVGGTPSSSSGGSDSRNLRDTISSVIDGIR